MEKVNGNDLELVRAHRLQMEVELVRVRQKLWNHVIHKIAQWTVNGRNGQSGHRVQKLVVVGHGKEKEIVSNQNSVASLAEEIKDKHRNAT